MAAAGDFMVAGGHPRVVVRGADLRRRVLVILPAVRGFRVTGLVVMELARVWRVCRIGVAGLGVRGHRFMSAGVDMAIGMGGVGDGAMGLGTERLDR
jgi:hypothetical protein